MVTPLCICKIFTFKKPFDILNSSIKENIRKVLYNKLYVVKYKIFCMEIHEMFIHTIHNVNKNFYTEDLNC